MQVTFQTPPRAAEAIVVQNLPLFPASRLQSKGPFANSNQNIQHWILIQLTGKIHSLRTREASGPTKVLKAHQKENLNSVSQAPKLCLLQAVGGVFGPIHMHAPFSLSDLKQIKSRKQTKVDLGKFLDDPDNSIDVLQGLGQSFDLTWRDIMLLLDQTLSSTEKEEALAAAQQFGDLWYLSQVNDCMTLEELEKFPTGQQAVPTVDPHWDTDSDHGDWSHRHLLTCILEGLRKNRKKPMNYSMLSTITQGKEENPSAFLERLREALRKHTSLTPDSVEGQLILKDKFITQSAADIRRKFQKSALGSEQNLETLLNLATSVFYNRDQEE
ncbi:uncharacterized protein [Macaca fascicularis]|uniref:uncharacterized protein n=1 Tax=Macaca fascicularis TaxID=9541 RepID=UPI003D15D438